MKKDLTGDELPLSFYIVELYNVRRNLYIESDDIMTNLREPYKKNSIITYQDLEKRELFLYTKKFSKKSLSILKDREAIKVDLQENINNARVWLLFGSRESDKWECLQVGHSKYEVRTEITYILDHFCTEEDFQINEYTNSVFYTNVCPKVSMDYRKYLYGTIGKNYNEFLICFLNVDKYLGLEKKNTAAITDADKIIAICKNQYAEAKVAYETLAKYWRLHSSGIDGQTISYFTEKKL